MILFCNKITFYGGEGTCFRIGTFIQKNSIYVVDVTTELYRRMCYTAEDKMH